MHPQIPAQLRMKSHTQLAAVADGSDFSIDGSQHLGLGAVDRRDIRPG